MSRVLVALGLLVGVGFPAAYVSAQAGLFANCCPSCAAPPTHCTCQTTRPVVETSYHQQQVVTYQNVAETRYQKQQYVTQVPVTRYANVTVDEGHYKMVWVPKPVTKQYAYTECRNQVAERVVPVTVQRTVPRVSTRIVPRQTVRYVTQQHTVAIAPQPTIAYAQPACPTCAAPAFTAAAPAIGFQTTAIGHQPTAIAPQPIGREHLIEQPRLPDVATNSAPVPDPITTRTATADDGLGGWTPIRRATRRQ